LKEFSLRNSEGRTDEPYPEYYGVKVKGKREKGWGRVNKFFLPFPFAPSP
jgi:hypothetical protein